MAVTAPTTDSTLVAMILVLLFLISHKSVLAASENTCTHHPLVCEFEQAKFRISQLESVLENRMLDLHVKSQHLGERTKLLEEINHEIDHLHSVLLILKDDPSYAEKRLLLLEEELRTLWDVSRRNNFDLHTLELKAQDAEKRLDVVASRAQKMADIVTEQWIQVQQLEQALQMAQMRTWKVKWQLKIARCTYFKFIKNLFGGLFEKLMGVLDSNLYENWSAPESYLSQVMHQLERIFGAAKYHHHQLQGYIKQEMEGNEFTAPFANKEVVFVIASALITFPILSAWMFLTS
ncbi:Myosin heavy chain [Heracleum sosnowskyi]|uniref:Myosin heavy chain n=1 Tax=Heracleum sosnowskyi TaxID=360622 RepID=A0AAD8MJS1_9APIA|nr:Myosin heavy chain [Heracleum sosnowskyi]